MADTTHFEIQNALAEEAEELRDLADRLAHHAPKLKPSLQTLQQAFASGLAASARPHEAERAAEAFARSLRP